MASNTTLLTGRGAIGKQERYNPTSELGFSAVHTTVPLGQFCGIHQLSTSRPPQTGIVVTEPSVWRTRSVPICFFSGQASA